MESSDRGPVVLLAGAPDRTREEVADTLGRAGCEVVVAGDDEDLASRDGVERVHRRVVDLDRPIAALVVHVVIGRCSATP